ncbi:transcription factor Snf5p [Purpureocillium lavendulum]|uniref:Transcription factor Snf5p n=1 Tax=Purpureocillium lavendulum TaxID=1247861 RepID=A0AB34G3U3_9HYPO|nr:transcription factor Snf5p [Purpureocillium lavendulum]
MATSQPSTSTTPATGPVTASATASPIGDDKNNNNHSSNNNGGGRSSSASVDNSGANQNLTNASSNNNNSNDDNHSSARNTPPTATATAPADAPIPVRTKESFNRLMVERYTTRDALAAAALGQQLQQTKKSSQEAREKIQEYRMLRNEYKAWFPPSRLFGEGYNGFANGYTENQMQPPASRIVYPSQKPRPGRRTTPAFKYTRKDMLKQAEQHEELVPVRLEVEWDKVKLRDTFTWNLHERILHVELFAAQLVEDMGLKQPAAQPVYEQIVQQMREQLNDFYPFAFSEEDALDPELPYSAYKNDEMRILIKLNITIGQHTLVDQFEWEINNPANSPEEFAASMARDLSLSGEFTTAIAHCIREQSQLFTKSLYSVGHPFDGRPVEDSDLVSAFLQTPLPVVFRPQQQAKDYAPYIYELSEADLERNETVFSREQRRQKRSINRRGGPQLPDLRERQRTIRTLIVSSVLPGAAVDVDESRLYKKAVGVARKRTARDGELSESEESEDSSPDSPAPSQLAGGTARTRGMRGAASAAQQRMANLGRSETPETSAVLHHHETRTSRRFREETEEPLHLWVTLRLAKDKLRRLLKGDYRDLRTPSQPQTPSSTPHVRTASTSSVPKAKATPTPTPQTSGTYPPGQIGRLPAPPPVPGQSPPPGPPPPEWLVSALKQLEKQYPNGDKFEAIMKYSYLDPVTELPIQGQPLPDGVKYAWLPRIRCLDCSTKLYTPGPDMTAQKFETHLKFSGHRDKVAQRLASQKGSGSDAGTSGS